jgi:hypothetical protein
MGETCTPLGFRAYLGWTMTLIHSEPPMKRSVMGTHSVLKSTDCEVLKNLDRVLLG